MLSNVVVVLAERVMQSSICGVSGPSGTGEVASCLPSAAIAAGELDSKSSLDAEKVLSQHRLSDTWLLSSSRLRTCSVLDI
jgi:glycerol-3-phosphate dehydrogenase